MMSLVILLLIAWGKNVVRLLSVSKFVKPIYDWKLNLNEVDLSGKTEFLCFED